MENIFAAEVKTKIKMSGIRKIISERMRMSLDSAAQATHVVDIDMSEIIRFRNSAEKISFTAIMVKALALSLKEIQIMNSGLFGDEIVIFEDINIAVAVALQEGLVAPVIRNADEISIYEIDNQIKDLSHRAKQGKLKTDELSGGTFTLSNLGMYGIDQFTAIINPPQAGILAAGAIKECVEAKGDEIKIIPKIKATLTYDHRIIDGAPAAEFLMHFKGICEKSF